LGSDETHSIIKNSHQIISSPVRRGGEVASFSKREEANAALQRKKANNTSHCKLANCLLKKIRG